MITSDNLTADARLLILQNAVIENNTKLEKHHKILLEGNGDLPLVERVRNLESWSMGMKFWIRTIAVALVLQAVTITVGAAMYFIKLYPVLQRLAEK